MLNASVKCIFGTTVCFGHIQLEDTSEDNASWYVPEAILDVSKSQYEMTAEKVISFVLLLVFTLAERN